jgi:hypothetical protein
MYKQILNPITGQVAIYAILRISDNAYIPSDPANTDYAAYLKWLAEGNQPEPADEITGELNA